MFTLFYKELRQHGIFAIAMVVICLLFQVTCYETSRWFNNPAAPETYLFIALIVTALYAGAAAALAFATELADNTYTFLRKLPVTPLCVAFGKIGWVLCGTVMVFACNLLLAAAWIWPSKINSMVLPAFSMTIIEMLIWGLFWSTRCRSQVHALLAGYASASLTSWAIANIAHVHNDIVSLYFEGLFYRIALICCVIPFVFWGALRWFDFEAKISKLDPMADRLTVRYPKRRQVPFFALVHQHIRHTSLLYHVGIASFCLFAFGCFFQGISNSPLGPCLHTFFHSVQGEELMFYWRIAAFMCMAVMLVFWGNIFGHDQKNDSYRFLSRLGIHEGKIWWSRILPAFLLYTFVLVGFVLSCFAIFGPEFIEHAAFCPAIWIAPMAVGAFCSISFRSQMVAISLTICGTLFLLGWKLILWVLFGCSPLWTTLPIAIALLIASRLRAMYWLRETRTWRSRFLPLLPCFAVTLAILTAIPFVRIYSIPYVSWEQIHSYFEEAPLDAIRSPERRNALLLYIATHGSIPESEEERLDVLFWMYDLYNREKTMPDLSYEEYLLFEYVFWKRHLDAFITGRPYGFISSSDIEGERKNLRNMILLCLPWEHIRLERALRVRLVSDLVASSPAWGNAEARALRNILRNLQNSKAVFDEAIRWFYDGNNKTLHDTHWTWISLTFARHAVERWYREHGIFPESLDILVEQGYLTEIPTRIFTDEPIRYYVNSPPPQELGHYNITFAGLNRWSVADRDLREHFRRYGGTYLMLGKSIWVLLEQEEPKPPDSISFPINHP